MKRSPDCLYGYQLIGLLNLSSFETQLDQSVSFFFLQTLSASPVSTIFLLNVHHSIYCKLGGWYHFPSQCSSVHRLSVRLISSIFLRNVHYSIDFCCLLFLSQAYCEHCLITCSSLFNLACICLFGFKLCKNNFLCVFERFAFRLFWQGIRRL